MKTNHIHKLIGLSQLLVDPREHGGLVVNKLLLLEPESNLSVGRLNGVRSVSNVSADINGVVTSDGTRGALQGVGGAEDGTALLDNVLTLPDGSEDGARAHVGEETGEETLGLEVLVVLTEESLGGLGELDGNKLEAALLEAGEDGGNEAALDSVRLVEVSIDQ